MHARRDALSAEVDLLATASMRHQAEASRHQCFFGGSAAPCQSTKHAFFSVRLRGPFLTTDWWKMIT